MRLHSKGQALRPFSEPVIAKITTVPIMFFDQRQNYCVLARSDSGEFRNDLSNYAGLVTSESIQKLGIDLESLDLPLIELVPHLEPLLDGDVVALDPSGFIRILYRRQSRSNSILVTERCNSLCLMCSQPPKDTDDSDRIREHLRLIDLIDPETKELGMTGGEPTLLKDDFLRLIAHCKERLPATAIHVLSNGRLFYYRTFAEALGSIQHPDLMLGIPVYSDLDYEHDFVVQAEGALHETIAGLHNLARYNVPVEIRVVLHALTFKRLPQLAEFIYRNLTFASHVALMGMEMTGFVHKNLDRLWVDPYDYREELETATHYLAVRGMNVSIYNHQLCTIPESLWPFARKSISDWKNIYLEECQRCTLLERCGGFFQSASKRHSSHINAFHQSPFESASCRI
jgi:His-Xaa-Ser system radical SAM maturase HxsC